MVINLFIPPVCLICHEALAEGKSVLCEACTLQLNTISSNYCPKCGTPMPEEACDTCAQTEFSFDFARSVFRYSEGMKQLIHELKYNRRLKVAGFLAEGMVEYLQAHPEFKDFDSISAVPLHTVRKRERGFNQSELIARHIARRLNLHYISPVQRSRYTSSQTRLHRDDRLGNLKGAFKPERKTPKLLNRRIILVDDIFTTGSTINEVSGVLKASGSLQVAGLTAARA